MAKGDIKSRLILEGESEYKRQMADAASALKVLNSEQKLAEAQFEATGDAQQYAADQARILKEEIEHQKKSVEAAEKAVRQLAENGFDKNSKKMQEWQTKLNGSRAKLLMFQNKLKDIGTEFDTTDGKMNGSDLAKGIDFQNTIMAIDNITRAMENTVRMAARAAKAVWDLGVDASKKADEWLTKSDELGIDVETYQSWLYASRFIDTSVDDITRSWQDIQKKLGDTNEEFLRSMAQMGVATKDGSGHVLKASSIFWNAIDALHNMTDETKRAEMADKIFGNDWRRLNPLIKAGSKGYKEMAEEGRQVGVVSEKNVRALGDFNDKYEDMQAKLEKLKIDTLAALAPTFNDVADALSKAITALDTFVESEEGQAALQGLNEALSGLIKSFLGEDNGQGTFQTIVENATEAVGMFTGALGWIQEHGNAVADIIKGMAGAWLALKITKGALEMFQIGKGAVGAGKSILGGGKNLLSRLFGSKSSSAESLDDVAKSFSDTAERFSDTADAFDAAADSAKQSAEAAKSSSEAAKSASESASSSSESASSSADAASSSSDAASSSSQAAESASDTASSNASAASSSADAASSSADAASSSADAAASSAESAENSVTAAQNSAAAAGDSSAAAAASGDAAALSAGAADQAALSAGSSAAAADQALLSAGSSAAASEQAALAAGSSATAADQALLSAGYSAEAASQSALAAGSSADAAASSALAAGSADAAALSAATASGNAALTAGNSATAAIASADAAATAALTSGSALDAALSAAEAAATSIETAANSAAAAAESALGAAASRAALEAELAGAAAARSLAEAAAAKAIASANAAALGAGGSAGAALLGGGGQALLGSGPTVLGLPSGSPRPASGSGGGGKVFDLDDAAGIAGAGAIIYGFQKAIEARRGDQTKLIDTAEHLAAATEGDQAIITALEEFVKTQAEMENATDEYLNGKITDEEFKEIIDRANAASEAFLKLDEAGKVLDAYNSWRTGNSIADWILPDNWEQLGLDAAGGLAAGLDKGLTDVDTAGTNLGDGLAGAVMAALDEHSPSRVMEIIGGNAAVGLANGIYDRADEAIRAAQWLANQVTAAVQSALDIHSPSKVLERLGGFTAEGFARGLEAKIAEVELATSRMAAAASRPVVSAGRMQDPAVRAQGSQAMRAVIVMDKEIVGELVAPVVDGFIGAEIQARR